MKLPLAPKPLVELMASHREQIAEVLGRADGPTLEGRYMHWDELRRRPCPNGLNSEQWWLGIKLARTVQFRPLPLCDVEGGAFAYMLPDRIQEGLHRIDSQTRGHVGISEKVANPDHRDRFVVNSLIREAITSSQLEGAATTRAVAAAMIRSGRRPKDRSERMILNNYRAMQSVRELKDEPLTLDAVRNLHATLTSDTLDDPEAAGRVQRPEEERVLVLDDRDRILHTPPPAEDLPGRMEAMIRFANGEPDGGPFLHPVIRAIALHFWLAYDHPFEDGNGRTARALFYWAMLRHGYWLFEFLSISPWLVRAPARYSRAFLHTETDGNDLTYFVVHQIEVILQAVAELETYIEKKVAEVERIERMLKRSTDLNPRQLALLAHAVRHPDARYTVQSHRRSHGVVAATARADLLRLAELELLDAGRIGRKTLVFYVPPDLEERLRSHAGRRP